MGDIYSNTSTRATEAAMWNEGTRGADRPLWGCPLATWRGTVMEMATHRQIQRHCGSKCGSGFLPVSRWRARLSAVSADSGGEAPGLGSGVMDSGVRRASLTTLGDIEVEISWWTFREPRMAM